jgi:hypothetical protein
MSKECGCHSDQECGCGEGGGGCGCGGSHSPIRQYQTKAEQTAELESYLRELKLEVQAVEEHLADLRK